MPAADAPGLRVLQVSAFFAAHGGGIEAVADQLARRLAEGGLEVHWMAGGAPDERPPQRTTPRLRIDQASSVDLLERRLGLPAPLWGPLSLWRLWRAVGRAQVVHLHDVLYLHHLLAALFAWLLRRPLVITQHVGEIPYRSAVARHVLAVLNRHLVAPVLRRAQAVAFVGRPVQQHFESLTRFDPAATLVPNGVDLERYHPLSLGPARDGPVQALFVGRFVEKKGLPLLRQCLDLAGLHWTFVGWGPQPPAEASRPGLTLAGRLPAAEIVAHYQQADLLVLPSTGEGFPLVVQEALACGTPVLVSAEVAEAFPASDPRCVFAVELRCSDPVAALRQALQRLAADPDRLRAAREPARELAQQWSWERCTRAYCALYRQVMAARG
ncbi:MAG: D-inositol-3-phosphate glycosyltransferase [Pseudomonadota bacterium]|jgi:glycosyltransferase involved in cell wall biosynthesis